MRQPDDWLLRWTRGQIGFHQSDVHPHLESLWPALSLRRGATVLVPMCGKSRDVGWLLRQGHDVVALDVSLVAIEHLHQEEGLLARRREGTTQTVFESAGLQAVCADFFDLPPLDPASFDAVYDRAAFGAMAPDLRGAYASIITALCQPGTRILLIVLQYPEHETTGPPFSISPAEMARQFGGAFSIAEMRRTDILKGDPRMRGRGVTKLDEVSYRLARLGPT